MLELANFASANFDRKRLVPVFVGSYSQFDRRLVDKNNVVEVVGQSLSRTTKKAFDLIRLAHYLAVLGSLISPAEGIDIAKNGSLGADQMKLAFNDC